MRPSALPLRRCRQHAVRCNGCQFGRSRRVGQRNWNYYLKKDTTMKQRSHQSPADHENQASRRRFLFAAGGAVGASALNANAISSATESDARGPCIVVPQRRVPVLAEADVLVCGGGTAGVSAACSAARHGAKVLLVERWPSVGGMATNALVNIWHTSDRTKQVIRGFVQEAIDRGGPFVRRRS